MKALSTLSENQQGIHQQYDRRHGEKTKARNHRDIGNQSEHPVSYQNPVNEPRRRATRRNNACLHYDLADRLSPLGYQYTLGNPKRQKAQKGKYTGNLLQRLTATLGGHRSDRQTWRHRDDQKQVVDHGSEEPVTKRCQIPLFGKSIPRRRILRGGNVGIGRWITIGIARNWWCVSVRTLWRRTSTGVI